MTPSICHPASPTPWRTTAPMRFQCARSSRATPGRWIARALPVAATREDVDAACATLAALRDSPGDQAEVDAAVLALKELSKAAGTNRVHSELAHGEFEGRAMRGRLRKLAEAADPGQLNLGVLGWRTMQPADLPVRVSGGDVPQSLVARGPAFGLGRADKVPDYEPAPGQDLAAWKAVVGPGNVEMDDKSGVVLKHLPKANSGWVDMVVQTPGWELVVGNAGGVTLLRRLGSPPAGVTHT
ncbi:uncharacterized protein HaLaN_03886 [Haematococcus lacustris]|uniref:Uncharacterized protein n=1 Tax=Haematococcus lacustris TaxID=44745 RepID=A0A699YFM3_HAELA|nr:uncharacterized protein HaLaN_03886 [Haematococcus lacustris]